MTEQGKPTEQAEQLEWDAIDDGHWVAPSVMGDAGQPFMYHVDQEDFDPYSVAATDAELLGYAGDAALEHKNLEAAKAQCERIESVVRASIKAEPEQADTPTISNEQAAQLFVARGRVKAALAAEDDANAQHKYLKKRREACEESLGDLIDSIAAGPGPLFEKSDAEQPAETDDPAEWRNSPLVSLTISISIQQRLLEHEPPLRTLGALSDHMAVKGDFWAKDIAGLGHVGQQSVEAAFVLFWQDHPEYCQPKPDDADAGEPQAAPAPVAAE